MTHTRHFNTLTALFSALLLMVTTLSSVNFQENIGSGEIQSDKETTLNRQAALTDSEGASVRRANLEAHEDRSSRWVHPVNLKQRSGNSPREPYRVDTTFGSFKQDEIRQWVNRYPAREWSYQLEKMLSNGRFYESLILERIDHYGLPRELFYLPVVESRYLNDARSWVGAEGIWQFMADSATPYGLKINRWRDDRRDFFLATDAALRKLRTNYRITGDWLLALAAYNCGLGHVTRAMKRSGLTDFWSLKTAGLLPDETSDYIPKLLAVIYIASRPDLYTIRPEGEMIQWTRVELHSSISLKKFAAETGISYPLLKKANAELNSDFTPADGFPYFLKVPVTHLEQSLRILEKIAAAPVKSKNNIEKS